MKILFLFFIGCFAVQLAVAQEFGGEDVQQDSLQVSMLNDLQVERDARLDKMVRWHIEKNEEREGMEGYRVEIFFSSNQNALDKATETKVDFLSEFPDYPVYIRFVAPNFRVRVGDFRTKNEAWKLYKKIEKDYPTAFVVPDIINFPQLKAKQYE
ncbi:SPOR domain-containing protein [Maribellus mangrovi]|uniref:SPOR domain-containing protein n=1 Tax=Maribellus mangrovi TaxID=3133146 RepID=UPI0030EC3CB4